MTKIIFALMTGLALFFFTGCKSEEHYDHEYSFYPGPYYNQPDGYIDMDFYYEQNAQGLQTQSQ